MLRFVTRERLSEIFFYDPESGLILQKDTRSFIEKSKIVTRRQVYVDGYHVTTTHVIWKLMTGEDVILTIDHRNRDTADNRWINLRIADRQQQAQNRGIRSDNTTGFKGVTSNGYTYSAVVSGVKIGIFRTKIEAYDAYRIAAAEIHGEFAGL